MVELASIIGVFLAIEGLLYAGAPSMAKKMAFSVSQMDESALRRAGLVAMCLGVGIVWMVRG